MMTSPAIHNRLQTLNRAAVAIEREAKVLEIDIVYERFCASLDAIANVERTISHAGLARAVGTFRTHLTPMLMRRMEEDHQAGRYLTCALVIADDEISDQAFFEKARQLGYDCVNEPRFWKEQRNGAWAEAKV